jgi:hypothetical protein
MNRFRRKRPLVAVLTTDGLGEDKARP